MTESTFLLWFLLLAFIQFLLPSTAFHPTNETDKLALLALKDGIHDDPLGVMGAWNESLHFCDWRGVWCSNRHEGRVTVLDLAGQKLVGLLPPHIGNLSFLRHINLSSNNFKGELPQEVGHLFRLRSLNLRNNFFHGKIPHNLSSCASLERINFNMNELTGEIPAEIGNLQSSLRHLYISRNHLIGGIPQWLGNVSSLEALAMGHNNLHGSIPNELGRQLGLKYLNMQANDLSGKVPPSIFNLSSLFGLSVMDNNLHGRLPLDIDFTLPNLQELYVSLNSFYGEIPPFLINATKLELLEMGGNNFSAVVPTKLGSLRNLQILNLADNQLKGLGFITSLTNCSSLKVLQFQHNRFQGELPDSIANLSTKLSTLLFGKNSISGEIPRDTGNLVSLTLLGISRLKLTGEIPTSIGKLKYMSIFSMQGNTVSGSIPSSLGNLTQLLVLNLPRNNLSGHVPISLGNCSQLQRLYLQTNSLTHNIPKQLFNLSRLLELDLGDNMFTGHLPSPHMPNMVSLVVSNNRFSGGIPSGLGNCLMLERLYMDSNLFEREIPPTFSSLRSLQVLNLSRNKLSSQIPKYFQNFTLLQYLNFSFNNFEGELPTGGVLRNTSIVSVIGNPRLCGGIHQLGFPPCKIQRTRRNGKFHRSKVLIAVGVSCSVLLIMAGFLLVIFSYKRKLSKRRRATSVEVQTPEGIPKISYAELSNATDGFSLSNLIGEGSFGSVYKGILNLDGMRVAVKVLNLLQKGASKSFIAECEALRNIRHRNLIKIVTVCSSIDFKGIDFKALVYEFMDNGSLEEWLDPSCEDPDGSLNLSFIHRLNIAIEVASAIEYLHNHCQPQIVHGDLKPSNILLDEDMVAHVGDFGLARFLTNSNPNESSSNVLKGTIGYVAPEYGMSRKASKAGDVYGFGILLLEMIIGKRPTDSVFKDGFTLHQFVKRSLPERVTDVLEHSLLREIQDAENPRARNRHGAVGIRETLVAVARIGVLCSMETSNERMEMKQVTAELN